MNKSQINIDLGDQAEDRISGFKGIVVCISHWLNGCTRVVIQSQKLDDGKTIPGETFDVEQLRVVKRNVIQEPTVFHGGPRADAQRQSNPTR